jgi:predicted metal-dependent RNase
MNAARDRIVSALPEEAGLIRCSAHTDDGVYELAVRFPDVFCHKNVDELVRLETNIGWSLKIRDTLHQGGVFEEALDCKLYFAEMTKAPALRIDRKEVIVQVSIQKDDGWYGNVRPGMPRTGSKT